MPESGHEETGRTSAPKQRSTAIAVKAMLQFQLLAFDGYIFSASKHLNKI
jgi:hypothetical protein